MRTVLTVDPFGDRDPATGSLGMVLKVESSPFNVEGASVLKPFVCAAQPAWGTPAAVREHGKKVRDALRQHAAVGQVLDALALANNGQIQPIFVKLAQGDAELITWETLCDKNDKFVALDRRWPIGRIVASTYNPGRPPTALRQPFKILAAISAFGVDRQEKEWQLLERAAREARNGGLDIRLRVLVGDPVTRSAVDASIAAGDTWIEVSHIESLGARVIQDIVTWDPSIVHFFCHGIMASGTQSLELATAADYLDNTASGGSVLISTQQLSDMSEQLSNPWLLMLNCCSSGSPVEDLQSMAFQCVAAKFPAAIAMLEPVSASDAHEFTRAFYTALFDDLLLAASNLQKASNAPFEWAHIMHGARTALAQLYIDPSTFRQWALPALYVRGIDPMTVERPSGVSAEHAAQYKLRAGLVAEWLQSQFELSAQQRKAAIEVALADVPKAFWPAPDGSFPPSTGN